jgi:hypothetical protein
MLALTAVFCPLKIGSKMQSGWAAAPFDPPGSTKLPILLTAESLSSRKGPAEFLADTHSHIACMGYKGRSYSSR